MNRESASQQIRASTDLFGPAQRTTRITRFGVQSGGYLGDPDCRKERISHVAHSPGLSRSAMKRQRPAWQVQYLPGGRCPVVLCHEGHSLAAATSALATHNSVTRPESWGGFRWPPVAGSAVVAGTRGHGGSCPAVLIGCGSAGPVIEPGSDLGSAQKLADRPRLRGDGGYRLVEVAAGFGIHAQPPPHPPARPGTRLPRHCGTQS